MMLDIAAMNIPNSPASTKKSLPSTTSWVAVPCLRKNDGNWRTVGNPAWLPLINTPNYPDYTSGANTVTGAATRALALFFGRDHMTFSVTTTNTCPTIQDTYV
jgi:hypothetical protein